MQALFPLTPGIPGIIGYEPAAIIILSAVYVSPFAFTVLGPTNDASPATTFILFALQSAFTPDVSFSTTLALYAWTFSQSTETSFPTIPMSAEPVAFA